MKRALLLILSLLIIYSASAVSSVQVTTGDINAPESPSVALKLSLKDTSSYQMGFTKSTVINDSLISLTSVALIPRFVTSNDHENITLGISDESRTIRGYWILFGNQSFEINIRLSELEGRNNNSNTIAWSATWKADDGSTDITAKGGETKLFYTRNFAESKEIESVGSKMITFSINEPENMSVHDLVIDSYHGYITMEVAAI